MVSNFALRPFAAVVVKRLQPLGNERFVEGPLQARVTRRIALFQVHDPHVGKGRHALLGQMMAGFVVMAGL